MTPRWAEGSAVVITPNCIAPSDADERTDFGTGQGLEALRRDRDRRRHRPGARRRRVARHHRAEWRRQDDVVQHRQRYGGAGFRPRALCRPRYHSRSSRAALHHGHRKVLPDPASVRRHERIRECRGCRRLRRPPARARRVRPLHGDSRSLRACRESQPTLGKSHPRRSQAARARARAGDGSLACSCSTKLPAV